MLKDKHRLIIEGHTIIVTSIAITSDNKYVVSGSWDCSIRVWNLQEKCQEAILEGHTHYVISVVIAHENKFIVSRGTDKIEIV